MYMRNLSQSHTDFSFRSDACEYCAVGLMVNTLWLLFSVLSSGTGMKLSREPPVW